MTRATKRPSPSPPSTPPPLASDDPIDFVVSYCKRRKIAYQIGASPVEKQCLAAADAAREQYKHMRNALHAASADAAAADRRGLSPAQKYTIRLHNNRKSANASKVYAEVLKREQAARLASIDSRARQLAHSRLVQTLNNRVSQLQQALADEKRRVAALQKDNQQLLARLEAHVCESRVQHSSTAAAVAVTAAHVATPPPSSMPEPLCMSTSTPLHQRIVNSRTGNVVPSWQHMSPLPLPDSDGKEFHTGLTCSQSQDVDDKSSLPRASVCMPTSSLPMSSAVQIGVLNSQTSQDIPPFKGLNSDDLVAPCPGSDFFSTSQPNSKLLCP